MSIVVQMRSVKNNDVVPRMQMEKITYLTPPPPPPPPPIYIYMLHPCHFHGTCCFDATRDEFEPAAIDD